MAASFTKIVADQKLAAIKKTMRTNPDVDDSPEAQEKLKKRIEKEEKKQEKLKVKREESHRERTRQREKLRSTIRDKYQLSGSEKTETDGGKKDGKQKKLKEKDFYKYNKAMPSERGKKIERQEPEDKGIAASFATVAKIKAEKAEQDKEKCIIS